MKKTIIKAGTPGIFRPGFGEFPEPESRVIAWQKIERFKHPYSRTCAGEMVHKSREIYAWQYVPAPPLVDDFEAWCEGWNPVFGFHTNGF